MHIKRSLRKRLFPAQIRRPFVLFDFIFPSQFKKSRANFAIIKPLVFHPQNSRPNSFWAKRVSSSRFCRSSSIHDLTVAAALRFSLLPPESAFVGEAAISWRSARLIIFTFIYFSRKCPCEIFHWIPCQNSFQTAATFSLSVMFSALKDLNGKRFYLRKAKKKSRRRYSNFRRNTVAGFEKIFSLNGALADSR